MQHAQQGAVHTSDQLMMHSTQLCLPVEIDGLDTPTDCNLAAPEAQPEHPFVLPGHVRAVCVYAATLMRSKRDNTRHCSRWYVRNFLFPSTRKLPLADAVCVLVSAPSRSD
jgi:hypothetical protein